MLSPAELAERWRVPTATIRAMLARGELPHRRLGRYIRIPLQAVEDHERCPAKTEDATSGVALPASGSSAGSRMVGVEPAAQGALIALTLRKS